MKKAWKIITSLFVMGLLISAAPTDAKAEYSYKVTFYSGNQGDFNGSTQGLSVEGSSYSIEKQDADSIVIAGLQAGATVSFDSNAGAVALKDGSKYYIQGVRESGRDNDEVASSAFYVDGDAEYVVAYGIQGDQVAYTVNFQDASGNQLAASKTYYGNVGDKPVVAYTYVDGYAPEYLALTKTLSANAAENVFTFIYRPAETVTVMIPGQTITNVTEEIVTVPGTTAGAATGTAGTTGNAAGTAGNAGGTTAGGTAGEQAGANAGPGNNTNDAQTGEAGQDSQDDQDNTTVIEDEETPLQQQELKDLDEEEVPKSNTTLADGQVKKSLPLVAGAAIGIAAIVALAVGTILVRKRMRR